MTSHSRNIDNVTDIISATRKQPTIINPASNFVVVTYWWGRGNYNNNTARPCIAFYEQFIQQAIKFIINTALTIHRERQQPLTPKFIEQIPSIIRNFGQYKEFLRRRSAAYLQMVFEHCSITANPFTNTNAALNNAYIAAMRCLNRKKAEGTCPSNFILLSLPELQEFLHRVVKEIIYQTRMEIIELINLNIEVEQLRGEYGVAISTQSARNIDRIKIEIDNKNQKKKIIRNKITEELKKKRVTRTLLQTLSPSSQQSQTKYFQEFEETVNIFDILNSQLRFLNPLKFEEMIQKWESECTKFNCNYLSVEYPQFAERGGYQLAINAKPIFIKKALELCNERAVVYIDGDMFIRKYPILFDINDVDFMARGWWIDPRSSYKLEESIMYDPYTFETSGGIMYFSQSHNAKFLVNKWIEIASKPSQAGKADDRVLSLVFNSYKMLLNMKIIQLPIEYLWLSLDYDDRMRESVYDYNTKKMKETIYIEHPECLTTEETAAGAGASSDRTPKFYEFLGEYLIPVSEVVHEYLMFPNKEMTVAFKDYYNYMDGITYIDDGNELLYKKGFVNPERPDENESPLYIVGYDKKLGDKKSPENGSLSFNDISAINFKRAKQMKLTDIPILKNIDANTIEIQPNEKVYRISDSEMISLILRLLLDDKTVIYNPSVFTNYDSRYYRKLSSNLNTLYKNIELGFAPILKSPELSDFFKAGINLSQPILFRPGNRIMIEFLSMFLSLEAFSNTLQYGAYEFISRVRIAYLKKDRTQREPPLNSVAMNVSVAAANRAGLQVQSGDRPLGNTCTIGGENINKLEMLLSEHEFVLNEMALRGGKRKLRTLHRRPQKRCTYKKV